MEYIFGKEIYLQIAIMQLYAFINFGLFYLIHLGNFKKKEKKEKSKSLALKTVVSFQSKYSCMSAVCNI